MSPAGTRRAEAQHATDAAPHDPRDRPRRRASDLLSRPAFRVGGKTVAGFAAFKNHLSYLPFSGSVIGQLPNELRDYATTKSSVHFPVDRPLPKALVKKLIDVRLADLRRRAR